MFQILYEAAETPALPLPEAVAAIYGPLGLPDQVLYANFVSSLDGVVAFEPEVTQSAGRVLSGGSPADRFLMGLLRACADAVVVGAGTARDEAGHVWTPERAAPDSAELFAEVRSALGLPAQPDVFIATASGRVDTGSPGVRSATVLGGSGRLDLGEVLRGLRERGYRRILTEGGPRLLGGLLAGGHVDELFLSLAPVIAGRDGPGRPGFVEGLKLLPENGRRARLLSLRRSEDGLLFLRYRLDG